MAVNVQDDWPVFLPGLLWSVAPALVEYLAELPEMKPEKCTMVRQVQISRYLSDPRMYNCQGCHRRFTSWTSACRPQEQEYRS